MDPPTFPWWASMRVWLAVAFAGVVAITAAATANVFIDRFEADFRARSEALAAGNAFEAAVLMSQADRRGDGLKAAAEKVATSPLFAFDESGQLLTKARSQGMELVSVPSRMEALRAALDGQRYVATNDNATVVGLPLNGPRAHAAIMYVRHPDLYSGVGIARRTIVDAALIGGTVGAVIGAFAAWVIAARLRKIAAVASRIERGDFDGGFTVRTRDEIGLLAFSIDRMRARLRESFSTLASERDRLGQILERLEEGVVTIDEAGRIEFANRAARRLLGAENVRVGEELGEPWPSFPLRSFAAALFEGSPAPRHVLVEDDEASFTVIGIPAGDLASGVVVIADVSEQQRREKAEREFVANASHELRTPLQTIIGAVAALRAGAKDDAEDEDRFLEHIEREASRLARLTHSLLVLARAQTREEQPLLEEIEVCGVLEEISAVIENEFDARVELDCERDVSVLANHELLLHALLNLCTNAARHGNDPVVGIQARRENGSVQIAVSDDGPGIPLELRRRVFDRFYRGDSRNGDGFGLGLAITRQSLQALGGSVELQAGPRGGTTAIVTVPARGGGS